MAVIIQPRSSRMAALLLTDIADSVALETKVGTEVYSRLLKLHHELFHQALECVPGGRIRNDTGDGILTEFDTTAGAVQAALAFQMFLRQTVWEGAAPRVRIGIHQGQFSEIQLEEAAPAKIVGMPVNIAARVMSLAQGGQILLTRAVYDDARQFVREHPCLDLQRQAAPALDWKRHGIYKPKGSDDLIEVFEVGAVGFAPFTAPQDSEKVQMVGRVEAEKAKPRAKYSALKCSVAAIVAGFLLRFTILGDPLERVSYDSLFLWPRSASNNIVLIKLDGKSFSKFNQKREEPIDRKLEIGLLERLTADGASVVVFDFFLDRAIDKEVDERLIDAIKKHGKVVLSAREIEEEHGGIGTRQPSLTTNFLQAAYAWGYADLGVQELETPRWEPFERLFAVPNLPAAAAEAVNIKVEPGAGKRWLRYYEPLGLFPRVSFCDALDQPRGFYSNKVVFVGSEPDRKENPGYFEHDKFRTPFTHWDSQTVGGAEILATQYMNLVNRDWLEQPAWWMEMLILICAGCVFGLATQRLSLRVSAGVIILSGLAGGIAAVVIGRWTQWWFPWLWIAAVQGPVAWAMAVHVCKTSGRR